jgi:hypothetical protein
MNVKCCRSNFGSILAYPYRKINVEMVVVSAKIIIFDPKKWGHCCDIQSGTQVEQRIMMKVL